MTDHLDEVHLRRLLVAVDGSANSTLALRAAITVARRDHATVTLITVAPDASRFAVAAGVPATTQEELDGEAERTVREAVALVPEDIPVRTLVRRGKPGHEIVAEAREGDYDAIVLGARGLGRVGAIIGSVSAHVLRHAPVAAFVAHAPADS